MHDSKKVAFFCVYMYMYVYDYLIAASMKKLSRVCLYVCICGVCMFVYACVRVRV